MIEEIGPNLVDAGLVNIAYILGIATGVIIAFMIMYMINLSNKSGFKHYYQEIDEASKKELDGLMGSLGTSIEFIALKTNTRFFKIWHNKFVSFTAYLKQRWLNS